jgi:uncharacterized protein
MDFLIGYVASMFIGILLGLVGGGGSILTVPILVYLFHIEPSLATAYSLFIVGITSLTGGIRSAFDHCVDYKIATLFSFPGFITIYLTRRFVLPMVPNELFQINSFMFTKGLAIMIFFAMIMFASAIAMIRTKPVLVKSEGINSFPYFKIIVDGVIVGFLTGIVGAGGGFLIIPALVLFAHLPMRKAVGTSLIIIAVNSLVGFAGDIGSGQYLNFAFLALISTIAIIGVFIGNYFSGRVHGLKLKRAFGWFVMVVGLSVVFMEMTKWVTIVTERSIE